MKRPLALTAVLLTILISTGLRAATNAHTAFTGGVGATNPCNGEGIGASASATEGTAAARSPLPR